MFGVLGAMLAVYGMFFSDPAIYERSLGININVWWGVILLAFGVGMYFFGRRANSAMRPEDESSKERRSPPRGH
jgi:protein-S-isoprenylcysteine O-methyltransferase Ste14